jgi:hypothetical protein
MTAPASPILEALTAEQVHRIRAMNDSRYRGWRARDVVKLHRRTAAADADGGAAYHAGIRQHLASGLYARIYPPHVVEATRLYLAQAKASR